MATKNISPLTASLFIGFLCVALLLSSGQAEERIWFVCQGPCSKFPDCNQACKAKGYPDGGKCMPPGKGSPLACCCTIT